MSRLVIAAKSDNVDVAFKLHKLLPGVAIADLREALKQGGVLLDMTIGYSEHDELAEQARQIVAALEEAGVDMSIYDLADGAPLADTNRVTAEVFRNILNQFDEIRGQEHD